MSLCALAVIETMKDTPVASALEVLGFCRELAGGDRDEVCVVLPGRDVSVPAQEISQKYGIRVICLEHELLHLCHPFVLFEALRDVMIDLDPRYAVFLHTATGAACASMLAASRECACVTGVESIESGAQGPVYSRPVFNGKLRMSLSADTGRALVTVLPGSYPAPSESAAPVFRAIERRSAADPTVRVECRGVTEAEADGPDLSEADVIVAAGRGIGEEKNLDLVRGVARMFPGGAVGASRPVVDRKWLPYSAQVGVTGKTVHPRLYFACGISGAQQHLVGIKGAQCVVAVNTDSKAAIFSVADYIVIEDVTRFLPVLLRKYRERYGERR